MLDGDERILPELEALLRGTYVEYLERRGHHVPPWAWINLLAHGSEDALRRAARTRRRRFFNVDGWRHARGYLAGEVIAAAQRAGSLREIQTTVLIPLELEHLSAPPARRTRRQRSPHKPTKPAEHPEEHPRNPVERLNNDEDPGL
jgi:hypothetical protein